MTLLSHATNTSPPVASIEALIALQAGKLAWLETHKRGLAQNLLPRPGYSQPRLRFPEFREPVQGMTERRKIAACMDSINALIAAQTRKLALLEAHREGLIKHCSAPVRQA